MTRGSKIPTGFIAICRCGVTVGALDYDRTDRREAGKIMGKWLADGCTVAPRFSGSWSEKISVCKCTDDPEPQASDVETIQALKDLLGFNMESYAVVRCKRVEWEQVEELLSRLSAPVDVQAKAEAVAEAFCNDYVNLHPINKQELSRLIVEQFSSKG
jgi:hypothetical protein